MLVPTYTVDAKNLSGTGGVSGRPMTFKIPGGALSQGYVAQAGVANTARDLAGQLSTKLYGMHADAVASEAMRVARRSVDATFEEARRMSPIGNGILGHFDDRVPQIRSAARDAAKNPMLRRRIDLQVAQYVTGRRAVLATDNTRRLVSHGVEFLNRAIDEQLQDAAIAGATGAGYSTWDGVDFAGLPAGVSDAIENIKLLLDGAVDSGLITPESRTTRLNTLLGDMAQNAVRARLRTAISPEDAAAVRVDLEETTQVPGQEEEVLAYPHLSPDDRSALAKEARTLEKTLITAGNTRAKADAAALKALVKQTQTDNAGALYMQLYSEDTEPLTIENLNEVMLTGLGDLAVEGAGLALADYKALATIVTQTGPEKSDEAYVAEVYGQMTSILLGEAPPQEQEKLLDALAVSLTNELARGAGRDGRPASRITISDFRSLHSLLSREAGAVMSDPGLQRIYRIVAKGFGYNANEELWTGESAKYGVELELFFWRMIESGLTPEEAAEKTVTRFGELLPDDLVGVTTLPWPFAGSTDLPRTVSLTVGGRTATEHTFRDVNDWKSDDLVAARAWAVTAQAKGKITEEDWRSFMVEVIQIEKVLALGEAQSEDELQAAREGVLDRLRAAFRQIVPGGGD